MNDKLNVVLHVHPRTASTSLLQYLQVNAPEHSGTIHHVHYLVNRRHKWHSSGKLKDIIGHKGKDAFKVITAVRDPVAVNLSAFWAWTAKHIVRDGQVYFHQAQQFFLETQDHHSPIHHIAAEVEAFWEVPIYTHPMHDEGWRVYGNKVLVLKYEHIDRWPTAIESFLGIPASEFPASNPSKALLQLKFTDAYLRSLYRSRHTEFFYSEQDVNEFVTKHGGTPYQRITGSKHVTVLGKDERMDGFRPVRVIEDEGQLPEDGTQIRAKVGIFGPHGKA